MKRNKFSLSHDKLLSCDMGELIPCGLTEVLPGDTIQQNTNCLVRFSPLLAPVLHQVNCQISHWYVPHRLVWEDFEDFITGGPDGNDASVFPTIDLSWAAGSPPTGSGVVGGLADYLGCTTGVDALTVSALPFRGYSLIWNEWFRDQDLEAELTIDVSSGGDTTTNTELQNSSWEKDYFTSARPWEQKGPAITIPLGTSAPVASDQTAGNTIGVVSTTQSDAIKNLRVTAGSTPADVNMGTSTISEGLYADLTGASAITVNALREALALQRFEEARARFGSRYVEYLRYLGVRSSDARLQRPEFLGGGRYPIQFSEVLQTAEGTDPVGELRGHGIGISRSNRYRRFIEEHGYIFTFMTIKPRTVYANGLFRHWNRRSKEDFFQKELQHIGQQEVLNKELMGNHTSPDGVFGYQDRYDEYRRAESSIAGEFRESTLNFWHFARNFTSDQALNAAFVKCVPPETPFAVPSQDVLYVRAMHSIQARRLLAKTGTSYIY